MKTLPEHRILKLLQHIAKTCTSFAVSPELYAYLERHPAFDRETSRVHFFTPEQLRADHQPTPEENSLLILKA